MVCDILRRYFEVGLEDDERNQTRVVVEIFVNISTLTIDQTRMDWTICEVDNELNRKDNCTVVGLFGMLPENGRMSPSEGD